MQMSDVVGCFNEFYGYVTLSKVSGIRWLISLYFSLLLLMGMLGGKESSRLHNRRSQKKSAEGSSYFMTYATVRKLLNIEEQTMLKKIIDLLMC